MPSRECFWQEKKSRIDALLLQCAKLSVESRATVISDLRDPLGFASDRGAIRRQIAAVQDTGARRQLMASQHQLEVEMGAGLQAKTRKLYEEVWKAAKKSEYAPLLCCFAAVVVAAVVPQIKALPFPVAMIVGCAASALASYEISTRMAHALLRTKGRYCAMHRLTCAFKVEPELFSDGERESGRIDDVQSARVDRGIRYLEVETDSASKTGDAESLEVLPGSFYRLGGPPPD